MYLLSFWRFKDELLKWDIGCTSGLWYFQTKARPFWTSNGKFSQTYKKKLVTETESNLLGSKFVASSKEDPSVNTGIGASKLAGVGQDLKTLDW